MIDAASIASSLARFAITGVVNSAVLGVNRDLATSGMTMIVVTDEMGFAKEVADRMMMFDEGTIIETGTPSQIFDNPQSDRTQLFLSQIL